MSKTVIALLQTNYEKNRHSIFKENDSYCIYRLGIFDVGEEQPWRGFHLNMHSVVSQIINAK